MTSETSSLTKDMAAYGNMRSGLETDYLGKWVVVHNEQVVDFYDTFQDAATDAVQRFGRGPYLIRRIGEPPIALPASVMYAPAAQHVEG